MRTACFTAWLSLPKSVRVTSVEMPRNPDGTTGHLWVVRAEARSRGAPCPLCGRRSRRVHSIRWRMLQDMSVFGNVVVLNVRVRRFFCDRRNCSLRIFTERLPDLAVVHARRTDRLKKHPTGVPASSKLACFWVAGPVPDWRGAKARR